MCRMGAIQDRISEVLAEMGLSQNELSRRMGVKQQTLNSFLTGDAPRWSHLFDIATELCVNMEWLQNGTGEKHSTALAFAATGPKVYIVGAVQAGEYMPAIEVAHDDREVMADYVDSARYPGITRFALRVVGDSINKLLPSGSTAICIKFLDLGRRPQNGELVVVHRHTGDGFEATIKRFVVRNDIEYLWPESTHPSHQAPLDTNSEEIVVHALVIGGQREF